MGEEERERDSGEVNTLSTHLEGAGPVSRHRCCFAVGKPEMWPSQES